MAVGAFFGFLWVTALGEELFFRGVIARALLDHIPSQALAVGLSAVVFGAAHLWFRAFPDWRRPCRRAAWHFLRLRLCTDRQRTRIDGDAHARRHDMAAVFSLVGRPFSAARRLSSPSQ